MNFPVTSTECWNQLRLKKWYWRKGSGLITWYYLRPHINPNIKLKELKELILGNDYFESEKDVYEYVLNIVNKTKMKHRLMNSLMKKRSIERKDFENISKYKSAFDDVEATNEIFTVNSVRHVHNQSNICEECINTNKQFEECDNIVKTGDNLPTKKLFVDLFEDSFNEIWQILLEYGWKFEPDTKFFVAPRCCENESCLNTIRFHCMIDVRYHVASQILKGNKYDHRLHYSSL